LALERIGEEHGVEQHDACSQARIERRRGQRDRPGHAVTAEDRSLHTRVAAHCEHVLGEVGDPEPVPRHAALTVAAQVERDHSMALGEMSNQGREVRPVAEGAVDQDQRRLAVPGVLERDLNSVRQDGPGAYD
jgi:hypothetical protein